MGHHAIVRSATKMGYTHYYYISSEFDAKAFGRVAADFKKMVTPLKHLGVILADGAGENYPTISPTEIRFNGLEKCGHEERDLGITWPSKSASGISKNDTHTILADITNSQWFAGAELETRSCDGDCSHETFSLEQKMETSWTNEDGTTTTLEPQGEFRGYTNQDGTQDKNPQNEIGKHFNCTKTAYKPYDLAVTVCLVIAKHHLGNDIVVHSDGTMENWHEAMMLCHHFLGYGKGFSLDDEDSIPLDPTYSAAMITQYRNNREEIASQRESQEKLEEEQREKISQIKERYRNTIRELERQQDVEIEKIDNIIDSAKEETDSTIEKLSVPMNQTDRVMYYLRRAEKTLDVKYADSVKNRRDGHLELVEKYSDDTISLQMYIVENGRPTNKYSLVIVGECLLGGGDEKILKLPYEYLGWRDGFDCSDNNIQVAPKHFKTIEDAKKYATNNNIQKILKKFFAQYNVVKAEYVEANSKYTLHDFEELFREEFSKYWINRYSYRESERKDVCEKLGINTCEISEMSWDDVLTLAENYGR